ncbi:MAG: transposase [Clostridia bacterium]|nr:transposase [Clostridia bacterium]
MSRYEKWKQRFGLEYVRRLAEEGLCDEDVATRSAITLSTLRRWKKRYPELCAAIELGRSGADYAVVEALYKKAVGYSVKVNKKVKLKRIDYDPVTGKKLREYEELADTFDEDYIPPDLRAEMFWLKSRQPDRWQEGAAREGEQAAMGGIIELPTPDSIDPEPPEED